MAQTATIEDILLEARQRADAETPDPTVDFTTDEELRRYATKAARQLIDLICTFGDGAIDLLATYEILTPPDYTLPATFYRVVAVDGPNPGGVNGEWQSLKPFHFATRNVWSDDQRPRYRVFDDSLRFSPETAQPTQIRFWYIAFGSDLAELATLRVFNGWDDYIVGAVAAAICVKEDRDPAPHLAFQSAAAQRIAQACADLVVGDAQTIGEVEHQWEELYDLV